MAAFELSDLDEVDLAFTFTKPDGSPGEIDVSGGAPTMESSDPSAATAIVAANGSSAVVRSGDNLAADTPVTLTLAVDVDLGVGVKTLSIPVDFLIKSHTAGQVSTGNVSFGAVRKKA